MKKLLLFCFLVSLLCLYSCFGVSNKQSDDVSIESSEVDFMMLSNPEKLKKVYDMVIAKLDTNIRHVDRLDMSISYPKAKKQLGTPIPNQESKTSLSLTLQYLNSTNQNKLSELKYYSISNEWTKALLNVEVRGGNVESFVLKDNLIDLSGLTFDKLNKVVQEEFEKFKDEEKYNYQYIYMMDITEYSSDRQPMLHIYMQGQLKSNELMKQVTANIPLRKVLQN